MKKTHSNSSGSSKKAPAGKKISGHQDEKSLLRTFFVDELKDIYWAEKYLVKSIPKFQKAATTTALKDIFENHLKETERQVTTIERVFTLLNEKVQAKKCEAIEGIIKEGSTIISDTEAGTLTRDVGLIMAAQKIEHYEIATYGGLAQLARTLEESEVAQILEQILDEEKEADKLLSNVAEDHINLDAVVEEEGELEDAEEEE